MARVQGRMARRELLWTLAGFALIQVALAVGIETRFLRVRDDEYVARRDRLQDRIAEAPALPLTIVMGTSRSQMAVDADWLNRSGGNRCVTFNMSFPGSGTMMHRVCLRRLLEDGIRPNLLFIELVPVQYAAGDRCPTEDRELNGARLSAGEMAFISSDHTEPWRMFGRWLAGRAMPSAVYRFQIRQCLPLDRWPDGRPLHDGDDRIDRCGFYGHPGGLPPDRTAAINNMVISEYAPAFRGSQLSPTKCQLLRDVLGDCRRAGIPTALILMPEGTLFRQLYPEGFERDFQQLLSDVNRDYGLLSVIDTRGWVPDHEFVDPHHLALSGARRVTTRFGSEVLPPLLARTEVARR